MEHNFYWQGRKSLRLRPTAWRAHRRNTSSASFQLVPRSGQGDPGDDEGSPFPAQCTFQLVEEFAPTPEAEFKHVLEYTERQRFKFKLSKWQCRDLVEAMCRHDAKLRAKRAEFISDAYGNGVEGHEFLISPITAHRDGGI